MLTAQSKEARVTFQSGSDGRINLKSDRIRFNLSGGSEANLTGDCNEVESTLSSGSDARMNVTAGTAVLTCSGASELNISGSAEVGRITASSGSDIVATSFAVNKLQVTASGGSDVRVWAIDELTGRANSASSIRYKGDPPTFNTESNSASSVRKIN